MQAISMTYESHANAPTVGGHKQKLDYTTSCFY